MSDIEAPKPDVVSPFALKRAFPDAQAIFNVKRSTLEETKADCFVALDANVLLLPYKLDGISLPDVIEVYSKLSNGGRLIIPAQAAREFAKHRAEKVGDLVKYLRDESSLSGPRLSKKVGALVGHTAYEALKSSVDEVVQKIKELRKSVSDVADGIAANVGEDPVSIAYRSVFKGAVREEPADCQDEATFSKSLAERYAERRPPGYKDKGKPDAGAGDLLIWKTILAEGVTRQCDCIFVTADEKADWYAQSHGPFQPRFELVEEYRIASGKTLHIVPLSGLLQIMQAAPSVVEEVQRAETAEVRPGEAWNRLLALSYVDESDHTFDRTQRGIRRFQLHTELSDVSGRLAYLSDTLDRSAAGLSGLSDRDINTMTLERNRLISQSLALRSELKNLNEAREGIFHASSG